MESTYDHTPLGVPVTNRKTTPRATYLASNMAMKAFHFVRQKFHRSSGRTVYRIRTRRRDRTFRTHPVDVQKRDLESVLLQDASRHLPEEQYDREDDAHHYYDELSYVDEFIDELSLDEGQDSDDGYQPVERFPDFFQNFVSSRSVPPDPQSHPHVSDPPRGEGGYGQGQYPQKPLPAARIQPDPVMRRPVRSSETRTRYDDGAYSDASHAVSLPSHGAEQGNSEAMGANKDKDKLNGPSEKTPKKKNQMPRTSEQEPNFRDRHLGFEGKQADNREERQDGDTARQMGSAKPETSKLASFFSRNKKNGPGRDHGVASDSFAPGSWRVPTQAGSLEANTEVDRPKTVTSPATIHKAADPGKATQEPHASNGM